MQVPPWQQPMQVWGPQAAPSPPPSSSEQAAAKTSSNGSSAKKDLGDMRHLLIESFG